MRNLPKIFLRSFENVGPGNKHIDPPYPSEAATEWETYVNKNATMLYCELTVLGM